MVLPVDDPFWQTHMPMNGWGCKCSVRSLSGYDVQKRGLQVSESPKVDLVDRIVKKDGSKQVVQVPTGIDPGFDYNVGQAWYRPFTPKEDAKRILQLAANPPDLPLPVATVADAKRLLPSGLTNEAYATIALKEFGTSIGKPVPFKDKSAGNLLISEQLFKDHQGEWKIQKNGREKYLLLLADAIKNPDEIWVALERPQTEGFRYTLRRRYMRLFELEKKRLASVVFEWGKHSWAVGISTFQSSNKNYIKKLRLGTLVWKKK